MSTARLGLPRERVVSPLPMRLLAALALSCVAVPALALTGREVIDQAQQKNGFSTWRDRTMAATMQSYDKDTLARTREITIVEQTDPRGEHRTFIRFVGPADVKDTRFLHLSPRGDKDQQWLWTPTTRRTRRLAEAQRDENFFGSDLSYRDLELLVRIQQWTDAEATATLVGEETIDGKPAYVVELVPKNDEFTYAKYRLWFGKDDLLLDRVDVYEDASKVLKRVTPTKYQRVGKYETAMAADVANLDAETHTAFTFRDVAYDQDVAEGTFAVANLDHG
jgi:hypothetical protein